MRRFLIRAAFDRDGMFVLQIDLRLARACVVIALLVLAGALASRLSVALLSRAWQMLVKGLEEAARGAVEAIEQITGIINRVNDISTTIASAVEEQTATTAEISRNAGEAARGSSEIAQNITGVAQAAQSTTSGAAIS